MCDRLLELRDAMSRYAAGFDAALLTGAQAEQAVRVAAVIERMAGAVKSVAAVRAAGTDAFPGAAGPGRAAPLGDPCPSMTPPVRSLSRTKPS